MKRHNRLEGIKAISFDADGTLWDFEQVMRHSLQIVIDALQQIDPNRASLLNLDTMISIRNRTSADYGGQIINLETIRLEAFRRTLQYIGLPDDNLASQLSELYLRHRFEDIRLYADVGPVLTELAKKYRLGILSNGNSYPERCGLKGVFAFTVFSQDYGVEKPSFEIFGIALKQAGCSETQLLHVGDSLINDVRGAAGAGIKSVWLNRKHEAVPPGIQVEYEIADFMGLLEIV